jgi:hypothetical protein
LAESRKRISKLLDDAIAPVHPPWVYFLQFLLLFQEYVEMCLKKWMLIIFLVLFVEISQFTFAPKFA